MEAGGETGSYSLDIQNSSMKNFVKHNSFNKIKLIKIETEMFEIIFTKLQNIFVLFYFVVYTSILEIGKQMRQKRREK